RGRIPRDAEGADESQAHAAARREADESDDEGLRHDGQERPNESGHERGQEDHPVGLAGKDLRRELEARQEADARHEDPVKATAEEEQGHPPDYPRHGHHGFTLALRRPPRLEQTPRTERTSMYEVHALKHSERDTTTCGGIGSSGIPGRAVSESGRLRQRGRRLSRRYCSPRYTFRTTSERSRAEAES